MKRHPPVSESPGSAPPGAASASASTPATPEPARTGAPLKVLQFICSTGFYGAEGWILALAGNSERRAVCHHLVVTRESASHDLELARRYRALGLPVHELALSGRFDPRAITGLVALIRRHRIDVVHTHGYKSDLLGLIAARLAGVPCICTPHGFENTNDWKLRTYIRLGCASFRFFDRVVPLSPELLRDVQGMHVQAGRIEYIANGVDLQPVARLRAEREQQRASATGRAPVIGYIGQLISRKNVGDLIRIYQRLADRVPGLRLVIVGDGDERAALEAQAAQLDCHDRVEFRGFVDNPLDHLQEFDLFVLCSSLEGIPRCLMEAMAMGVPIAAYAIPGVDQLITHEQTGLLAPLGDSDALGRCCERILTDTALAGSLQAAATQRVHEDFSAARMAAAYLALYRQLTDSQVTDRAG